MSDGGVVVVSRGSFFLALSTWARAESASAVSAEPPPQPLSAAAQMNAGSVSKIRRCIEFAMKGCDEVSCPPEPVRGNRLPCRRGRALRLTQQCAPECDRERPAHLQAQVTRVTVELRGHGRQRWAPGRCTHIHIGAQTHCSATATAELRGIGTSAAPVSGLVLAGRTAHMVTMPLRYKLKLSSEQAQAQQRIRGCEGHSGYSNWCTSPLRRPRPRAEMAHGP